MSSQARGTATARGAAAVTRGIYAGAEVSESDRETLRRAISTDFPQASVEVQSGDQALYPYIVAVE